MHLLYLQGNYNKNDYLYMFITDEIYFEIFILLIFIFILCVLVFA